MVSACTYCSFDSIRCSNGKNRSGEVSGGLCYALFWVRRSNSDNGSILPFHSHPYPADGECRVRTDGCAYSHKCRQSTASESSRIRDCDRNFSVVLISDPIRACYSDCLRTREV